MDLTGAAAAAVAKQGDEAAAEAAKTASRLWLSILQPSAEQIGKDLLSRYQNSRVQKVVAGADRRNPSGSIPLRLAASVYEAASVSDEEVVSEYLSGILASSRTGDGVNDAGMTWAGVVSRLPVNALRVHYLLSATVHVRKRGQGMNLGQMLQERVAFPTEVLTRYLVGLEVKGADDRSGSNDEPITAGIEALTALQREGLVAEANWGPGNAIAGLFKTDDRVADWPYGFTCKLLPAGVSLLFWGLGLGRTSIGLYCSDVLDLKPLEDWTLPESMPELVFGVS